MAPRELVAEELLQTVAGLNIEIPWLFCDLGGNHVA